MARSRSGRAAASDRQVLETERVHLSRVIEVSSVDENRTAQRGLHARKIRMPILVPIRDDSERVRPGERVIARSGVEYALTETMLCFVHRDGVVYSDRRASGEQIVDQRQRGRFAHVVRIWLER